MTVVVQNDVAVATVELPICGGVHGHFIGAFDSPDLLEKSRVQNSGQLGKGNVMGPGYPMRQTFSR